jgi:fumarate hydratase subunit beta
VAEHHIRLPLSEADLSTLRTGDYVYLSGVVYTARDAAHRRMNEALGRGKTFPSISEAR